MLKHGHTVLLVGLVLLSARTANAQAPLCNFFHVLHRDFVRNNSWPEPFVQPDRENVYRFNDAMIAKGWERQNLLGPDFFLDDSSQLNRAGETHLREILISATPQHRTVYVQRSLSPAVTAARVKAVQQTTAAMLPRGEYADIVESNMQYVGSPGDRQDVMNRKSFAAIPDPKLPIIKDDSGGGGGGGS